jgi:hypothetical protein
LSSGKTSKFWGLGGQVTGAAEPGLILTPPAKGTINAKMLERDDGFVASSEIATLKLARCRLGDPISLQYGGRQ